MAILCANRDTVSALAMGTPVMGQREFLAPWRRGICGEIRDAAETTQMQDGVFALLFNAGQRLVAHAGISGGVCRLVQRRPGTSRHRSGATAADSILRGDEQRQSGVRLGESDLEQRRLNIIMKKTGQRLEVPLNDGAAQTLEAKQGAKHGPCVFYNPTTGDRFHDVKLGLKSAVKRAGLSGHHPTWHTFRHYAGFRIIPGGLDFELIGGTLTNIFPA